MANITTTGDSGQMRPNDNGLPKASGTVALGAGESSARIGYDLDLEFCKDNPGDPRCVECGVDEPAQKANKYQRPCKGVMIDVYDVLQAWNVTNPALQHLIKKALCPGERGHKDRQEDLQDILDSAKRAIELEKE